MAQIEQSDESERDGPERGGQIEARKRCGFVGECAGHEARSKKEPVQEAKFFHVVRAPTGDDRRRDPKKSERERGAPLFRDEINKRKKKYMRIS